MSNFNNRPDTQKLLYQDDKTIQQKKKQVKSREIKTFIHEDIFNTKGEQESNKQNINNKNSKSNNNSRSQSPAQRQIKTFEHQNIFQTEEEMKAFHSKNQKPPRVNGTNCKSQIYQFNIDQQQQQQLQQTPDAKVRNNPTYNSSNPTQQDDQSKHVTKLFDGKKRTSSPQNQQNKKQQKVNNYVENPFKIKDHGTEDLFGDYKEEVNVKPAPAKNFQPDIKSDSPVTQKYKQFYGDKDLDKFEEKIRIESAKKKEQKNYSSKDQTNAAYMMQKNLQSNIFEPEVQQIQPQQQQKQQQFLQQQQQQLQQPQIQQQQPQQLNNNSSVVKNDLTDQTNLSIQSLNYRNQCKQQFYGEAFAYNSQWWNSQAGNQKPASVQENAQFDKYYAQRKMYENQQSNIFSNNNKDEILTRSLVIKDKAEQEQQLQQQYLQQQQQQMQYMKQVQAKQEEELQQSNLIRPVSAITNSDIRSEKISNFRDNQNEKLRRADRNFSDLFETEVRTKAPAANNNNKNQGNNENQMPVNLKFYEHDSIKYQPHQLQSQQQKIQDSPSQKQISTYKYMENMKSHLDTHNYQAEYKLGQKINNEDLAQSEIIQQQQQQQIQNAANMDLKIEQFRNQQLVMQNVSAGRQVPKHGKEVKVIELEVKGINDKFDEQSLKKFCSGKGYHLVQFNSGYNKLNNKLSGRGQVVLRVNRKNPEHVDNVKGYLGSLGIKVTAEEEKFIQDQGKIEKANNFDNKQNQQKAQNKQKQQGSINNKKQQQQQDLSQRPSSAVSSQRPSTVSDQRNKI